ncbi:MAG: polysaccharide pyruvyl transferase family protein, partial [Bdellovibrionota bacterium]
MSSLNLLHLANFHSTNIGNGALVSGLESTLEEDLRRPINWSREPWDDYTFRKLDFDQTFVDKVNSSDGLIVGGAVTFNGRDYNNRTGTRFELPLELWDQVRKPVVFYGLSYRHWPGKTYHHIDKLKATIERILESKNMVLALRNDGTREWLKKLIGIDSPKIFEVPDSAVFVKGEPQDYPEIVPGMKNIIVSFNDEDASERYSRPTPGNFQANRERIVRIMIDTLEKLADRYPVNIILCPHYFDDFKMMSAFIEGMRPRLAHQNMVATGLARVKDTGWFYGRYMSADLAISMRVHSMSPCIGLGTPMVALTTQDRMTDFISRLELDHQAVDAFSAKAAEDLYTKAVHTLDNPAQVKADFKRARAMMREQTRQFHQGLAE